MKEQLAKIRAAALEAIADSNAAAALDSVRVKYLGKKGELTSVLKQMGKLSAEERPVIGQIANEVRETLTKAIADQQSKLAERHWRPNWLPRRWTCPSPASRPSWGIVIP